MYKADELVHCAMGGTGMLLSRDVDENDKLKGRQGESSRKNDGPDPRIDIDWITVSSSA